MCICSYKQWKRYEWRKREEYSFSSYPFLFELPELIQFCYYSNACNKNKQKKSATYCSSWRMEEVCGLLPK